MCSVTYVCGAMCDVLCEIYIDNVRRTHTILYFCENDFRIDLIYKI